MFFAAVNLMEDDQGIEETRCNLDEPRIVPKKNTLRPHQNTMYWCHLKLAQKRGLQFNQTRSHAIVLYDTLPAICIKKAVCMKTGEEFYHKNRSVSKVASNDTQSGQQDQPDQEARKILRPPKRIRQ